MSIYKFIFPIALISISVALQLPSHADWKMNEIVRRKVSFEVKNVSMDDYLLTVVKAYGVNLILDSTHLPQDAPPISRKIENKSLWASLQSFASRNGINGESLGDGSTILLWQQPDMETLARELIASGETKSPPADTPSAIQLINHRFVLRPLLSTFFREKKGWNGQRPFKATVGYEELPGELQARLAVQTRGNVWNLIGNEVSPQWFGNDLWKSARLRTMAGRDSVTGQIRQEIVVAGVVKRQADGSQEEECVFVAEPGMPFRISHGARLTVGNANNGATPDNDTVLAQSSLAAPYQPAPELDLAAEVALSQKITLEVKRQPLDEVVKALSEKSGVALSVSPEVNAKGTLLTLGIQEMPLHETLTALTRLLGYPWTKVDGGGYSAQIGSSTVLDRQLLQGHELAPAETKAEDLAVKASNAREAQEWTNKIRLAVSGAALMQPEGIAFSDLPEGLQSELRSRLQTGLASVLVDSQSRLRDSMESLKETWHVELDVPAEPIRSVSVKTPQGVQQINMKQYVMVRVVSQDGRTLTAIDLPNASQAPPQP